VTHIQDNVALVTVHTPEEEPVYGLARYRFGGDDWLVGLYDPSTDRIGELAHAPKDWRSALEFLRPRGDGSVPIDHLEVTVWRSADEIEFLPPVDESCRVFCVAQNYQAHARESSGTAAPREPVIFLKPNSALVGHRQPTRLPHAAVQFDWEAELVVVVGADLDNASPLEAASAMLGWTIANDGTARDLQPITLGGRSIIDWFSAKSIDRSSVMGPAVFPAANVPDPRQLRIRLSRNGERMQDERASEMVVSPARLLSHISRVVSLHPGDVLLTGTPAGVGKGRGVFLDEGDLLEITVEPLATVVTHIES